MLIKCSECGAEVSDKSDVCIKCGAPIRGEITSGKSTVKDPDKDLTPGEWILGTTLLASIITYGTLFYLNDYNFKETNSSVVELLSDNLLTRIAGSVSGTVSASKGMPKEEDEFTHFISASLKSADKASTTLARDNELKSFAVDLCGRDIQFSNWIFQVKDMESKPQFGEDNIVVQMIPPLSGNIIFRSVVNEGDEIYKSISRVDGFYLKGSGRFEKDGISDVKSSLDVSYDVGRALGAALAGREYDYSPCAHSVSRDGVEITISLDVLEKFDE